MEYQNEYRGRGKLIAYCIGHFLVDMVCFFCLFASETGGAYDTGGAFDTGGTAFASLILLYNGLAFGLQPLFGLLADRLHDVRPLTAVGLLFIFTGLMLFPLPLISVVLLGLGNAIYHVCGASEVLHDASPVRCGIYVAPGALGVACGTLLGKGLMLSPRILMLAVIVLSLVLLTMPPRHTAAKAQPVRGAGASIIMLTLAVAVRSFAGSAPVPFETTVLTGLALSLFAFGGKAIGGCFARVMPMRIYGALFALAGGLLTAFSDNMGMTQWGSLLVNAAMPITLYGMLSAMPSHTGAGFGLTALALFFGQLPYYTGSSPSKAVMAASSAAAAILIFLSPSLGKLRLLSRKGVNTDEAV